MKWGGIIASAMMGGVAGAGQGAAQAAKMAYDEDIERRKMELAQKREEALAKLRHDLAKPQVDRELAIREGSAAESARHNKSMEELRVKEVDQQGRHQANTLAEHAKDRQSRERLAKQAARNIQTLEDGTLATFNAETNTMEPIRDPGTGEPLKGPKDLSMSDKTKVSFLQSSILELQKERAKALDDAQRTALDSDISIYRKQLYDVLGMTLDPRQSAKGGGGGGKPWERFQPGAGR